jgi:hypothetical protein
VERSKFRYLETLDELGYIPVQFKEEEILYESIIKSFESLGKSTSNALLDHMCSLCSLSEKELLTNYELFEQVLNNVFGRTAERLLDIIKRELLLTGVSSNKCNLTASEILDPSLTIRTILNDIQVNEITEFLKSSTLGHIAFLYRSKAAEEKILSRLIISSKKVSGSVPILSEPSSDTSNSFNILYNALLDHKISISNNVDFEKLSNCPNRINSDDKFIATIKLIHVDGTWWLSNNLHKELILFEEILTERMIDNCVYLCCFDIAKFDDKKTDRLMRTIIEFHPCVILDEPTYGVYKSPGNNPRINNICLPTKGDNK